MIRAFPELNRTRDQTEDRGIGCLDLGDVAVGQSLRITRNFEGVLRDLPDGLERAEGASPIFDGLRCEAVVEERRYFGRVRFESLWCRESGIPNPLCAIECATERRPLVKTGEQT